MSLLHGEITEQIIGATFDVYRELGYGYLEKVYQRAMVVELKLRRLKAIMEAEIEVYYKQQPVGTYRSDLLVNDTVIAELKVAPKINDRDQAQLINLLKATQTQVGLLINFGKEKAEFKRLVY